jgi:hypothetical protein
MMDCLVLKTVIFPFLTEQKKIIGKGDRKRGQDRTGQVNVGGVTQLSC